MWLCVVYSIPIRLSTVCGHGHFALQSRLIDDIVELSRVGSDAAVLNMSLNRRYGYTHASDRPTPTPLTVSACILCLHGSVIGHRKAEASVASGTTDPSNSACLFSQVTFRDFTPSTP